MKHLLFLLTAILFSVCVFSQTTVATQVTLTGSGTDTDGTVVGYAWTQVSGPATPTIVSPTSAITVIKGYSVAGTYVYALVVTDNSGAKSAPSQVTVTVLPANIPPVANAGGNQTIQLPASGN